MPDRLAKRGDVYYFRASIPNDLHGVAGKNDRWVSLRTREFQEARKRLPAHSLRFDAEMEEHRRRADAPVKESLTRQEVDRIATAYYRELMEADEDHRTEGLSDHDYRKQDESLDWVLPDARRDLARGRTEEWHDEFDDWLESNGHRIDPETLAYRQVTMRMLQEFVRYMEGVAKRQEGQIVETPAPTKAPGLTVKGLIAAYLADPAKRRHPKTILSYRIVFDAMAELIGPDRPAEEVTRGDCERVRDILMKLPNNARTRYPGATLEEAVELGRRDEVSPILPKTINNYLNNLASLFNWGVTSEKVTRNPAKGLSVFDPVPDNKKRKTFKTEALAALFNAPLYRGCMDDDAGYNREGPIRPRRGRFWVPLLSLFHGIRLGEACQLHVADVTEEDGVPVLILSDDNPDDMDETDRKRIKTKAGNRFVPLHPEVIRIGFLEWVAEVRKTGRVRLFPEQKRGESGYFDAFSKWFSRLLKQVGVKEKGLSFHSTRHTYRDALRRARAPRDVAIALGGWSGQGTDDDYGDGLSAKDLSEYVGLVRFEGLDLSHLFPAPPGLATGRDQASLGTPAGNPSSAP